MRASSSFFYVSSFAVSFVLGIAFPCEGLAEFRCSADISYTWVKAAESHSDVTSAPPPTGALGAVQQRTGNTAQAPSTPTTVPVAPPSSGTPPEPTVVHLMGVERVGATEVAAKTNLQMEVERQRIRASESCRRDHESFGTCVAMKLSANSSVLNSLGFGARSELEKALTNECRQQQGTCVGVKVSEAACTETQAAPAPAGGGPTPEPDKKPATKKK